MVVKRLPGETKPWSKIGCSWEIGSRRRAGITRKQQAGGCIGKFCGMGSRDDGKSSAKGVRLGSAVLVPQAKSQYQTACDMPLVLPKDVSCLGSDIGGRGRGLKQEIRHSHKKISERVTGGKGGDSVERRHEIKIAVHKEVKHLIVLKSGKAAPKFQGVFPTRPRERIGNGESVVNQSGGALRAEPRG